MYAYVWQAMQAELGKFLDEIVISPELVRYEASVGIVSFLCVSSLFLVDF